MPGVGRSVSLLVATGVSASDAGAAVTGNRRYKGGTFTLDVTSAATAAGDTLNVYVQRLLPTGAWDDVVSFTQVLGNGGAVSFVADVMFDSQATDEGAVSTAALAAGTARAVALSDSIRVQYVIVTVDTPLFTFEVAADLF